MNSSPLLSMITPFYAKNHKTYLSSRTLDFVEQCYLAPWLERILVDQGSPVDISQPIKAACESRGIRYVHLGKGNIPFSIGLCRNSGVQQANGEFVSFQDVDLLTDENIYNKIKQKIISNDLPFNHLETIPCLYLTAEGTSRYLNEEPGRRTNTAYDSYLEGDDHFVQMVAPATSCLIVRRLFYLSEGGVRGEFFGHGYEDFELMNRLAYRSNKYHRSHDYYSHTPRYDSLEYKGYRTYFSMFGRQNLAEKVFFVHLHHETLTEAGYKARNSRNRALFDTFIRSFELKYDAPPALDDPKSDQITLCIGSRSSIPYRSIRMAIPYFGNVLYRHERDFSDIEIFNTFLHVEGVKRVVFLTPYGNEDRLQLYRYCRENNFPIYVFDRGALPDSWFFDPGGFNAESSSYKPEKWDKVLTHQQAIDAEGYIHDLCSSDETLEENGPRVGETEFRQRFGLLDKRVIFVPLQRPNDSVIRYLSGNVDGVDQFCNQISLLAQILPHEWKIIVKQHPLEDAELNIPGATMLPPDAHVYDAIGSSDAVVLINSGVGLLSLCFGKPVFCFGEAFYAQQGLAVGVLHAEDLAEKLLFKAEVDSSKILQFIHYLVFEFYSFASTKYLKIQEGVSSRNVAVHLDFYTLCFPNEMREEFRLLQNPVSTNSPAYDYFRAYFKKRNDALKHKNDGLNIANTNVGSSETQEFSSGKRISEISVKGKTKTFKKIRKLFRDPRQFFVDVKLNRTKRYS